jgi:hypothetical protein
MTDTVNLPAWTTHLIDFGARDGRGPSELYDSYAAYMEHAARTLGGLRIVAVEGDRDAAALDGEAVEALRSEPDDANGVIDDEMRCWVAGSAFAVEPADGTGRIGSYA